MLRALLAVARAIASAHDRWRESIARRRALSVEVAVLHERIERLRAENDLLRARLNRLLHRREFDPGCGGGRGGAEKGAAKSRRITR